MRAVGLDARRIFDLHHRRGVEPQHACVNHKDLIAMHSAITEVGALYATASVHDGWDTVGKDGVIRYDASSTITGGHAFAIVASDKHGFWIQNSWGRSYGTR